ncbi:alpha-L-fucosidase [Sphingobium sp. BYY-5]|uniref:alpha-L-fucosidase n=1 Tax=Sphingobium sp. BYY-5 TaxID=2926400 RepID=UPI001FA756CD|nr:alpha-L-fucosidase [Sphingobium sp. BYY-5]MCI4590247.1 alpha-L-fucosidase [Sphingobium sp. BYY-5]
MGGFTGWRAFFRTRDRKLRLAMLLSLGLTGDISAWAAAEPPSTQQAGSDEQKSALKTNNSNAALAPELRLSEADMAWWRDAKLGMFIHWGLYSIPASGEWSMFRDHVPAAEYAKLAQRFAPKHYDPQRWAKIARTAGARYMVLTARHHDGFALWDSPGSYGQFDAVHSAARRDLVKPFVTAARQQGLRVGLYYSPLDWRFPAYFHIREMPENAAAFRKQTYDQVRELTTRYGRIDILWYDGGWLAHNGTDADAAWFWRPEILNAEVREHQPKIVINPRSGWQGDFDTEEGAAPITGPIRPKPWEKTFSLNENAWGYTSGQRLIPLDQLKRLFVDAVIRNGNLHVNVGPDPDGVIPEGQERLLHEFGVWNQRYGESLFATRPGPLEPVDGSYGTTHRGRTVYLHVLSWPDKVLTIPALPGRVLRATNMVDGKKIDLDQSQGEIRILAPRAGDSVDTVLKLELETSGGGKGR